MPIHVLWCRKKGSDSSRHVGQIYTICAPAQFRAYFLAILLQEQPEQLLSLHFVFGQKRFPVGIMAMYRIPGSNYIDSAEGNKSEDEIYKDRCRGECERGNRESVPL